MITTDASSPSAVAARTWGAILASTRCGVSPAVEGRANPTIASKTPSAHKIKPAKIRWPFMQWRANTPIQYLIQGVHFHNRDAGRVPYPAHDRGVGSAISRKIRHDRRFRVVARRDGRGNDFRFLAPDAPVVIRPD